MKRTSSEYASTDFSVHEILYTLDSRADGLPSYVRGDTIYDIDFFTKTAEHLGSNVEAALGQDFLNLQKNVVLGK
jgi:hypothetical protein